MKRILITGKHSYIGNSFEKWIKQFGEEYQIDKISLRDNSWKKRDFSIYDVVLDVAGIAHADTSKASEEIKKLYYKVNCDLAFETAKKYKKDLSGRTGQFIYMSSIIVYGIESNLNKKRIITTETIPHPTNFYGDSKLQAEKKLTALNSSTLKMVILRPPMIYGKDSKGNFSQLVRMAKKIPVFPKLKNARSMLYIGNLCIYLKDIIDGEKEGIYFPQNQEYVATSEMVRKIAENSDKRIRLTVLFNWLIKLLSYVPGKIGNLVNKAFGSLVYEKGEINPSFIDFETSIVQSIGNNENEK